LPFNNYTVQHANLGFGPTRTLAGERFHNQNSIALTLIAISIDEFSVSYGACQQILMRPIAHKLSFLKA
jgi:hypothetical protein